MNQRTHTIRPSLSPELAAHPSYARSRQTLGTCAAPLLYLAHTPLTTLTRSSSAAGSASRRAPSDTRRWSRSGRSRLDRRSGPACRPADRPTSGACSGWSRSRRCRRTAGTSACCRRRLDPPMTMQRPRRWWSSSSVRAIGARATRRWDLAFWIWGFRC